MKGYALVAQLDRARFQRNLGCGFNSHQGRTNLKIGGTFMENSFDDCEVISVYSRKQAIEDGVLVDISHTSEVKECGFKAPVCVTDHLWNKIRSANSPWGDWHGRLWDVCTLAKLALRNFLRVEKFKHKLDHALIPFRLNFAEDKDSCKLWLVFNEKEGFTIMFPEDD